MKKIFVASLTIAITLASCNVKNSEEYKKLQAEKDSLEQTSLKNEAEMGELMQVISEVEENFDQIKEVEKYLAVTSKTSGELSQDTKSRVRSNFQMVNEILAKNKEQIRQLTQRVNSSSGNLNGLKKTIELLNKQLEEKEQALQDLRSELSVRDKRISELELNLGELEEDVSKLSAHAEDQAAKLKAQEAKIYAGYYMFGNKDELKKENVAQGGGFLSTLRLKKEGLHQDKFMTVDTRETTRIPVYSQKCNILTDHPKNSYTIETSATKEKTIIITDSGKFWGASKYLVIETN